MTALRDRTRRDFLRTGSLALAGAVLAGAGNFNRGAPKGKSSGVRFGVRTPFQEKDLRQRALLLQRLGYDGIELGQEWLDRSTESILADLEGTGIVVSAIVGSIKLLEPDPQVRAQAIEIDRKRLEMARTLGAVGVIEVPTFGPCRFPEAAKTPAPHELEDHLLIEGLKQLAGDVKRTGIHILVEPLTKKETHFMNLQSHGARIIEAVGSPGFKLLSDFYHMQLEEADIGATLTRYGKYTAYVHLADGEKRTEPGSLPFDYRPGFRGLKKNGFSGWLTVESRATDNPEAALARALKYLKQQWSEA
ncbi:MAG: hypothetical protein DMG06_24995 [Acidobacteria bacterium]|nr:MAG: hypothetical protein DMG06_24995 [Acidobacteriota bacterium]